MTAKSLREYALANSRLSFGVRPKPEWYEIFTPTTVSGLINEIDRLRVLAGEKPSYESDGTLQEALNEMLGD